MLPIDLSPSKSQLRTFAWASLVMFPLIGAVLHFWQGWVGITVFWVLVAIGAAVWAAAMVGLWAVVRWVFVGLILITFPIGFVVSNLLLGLVFFLMFTPMALFFRLRGRDAMRRKLDRSADSYWDERSGPIPAKRYLRMY